MKVIPPREELEYYLDEIMRDAKTQREAMQRLGQLYTEGSSCVQWQKAKQWLQVHGIELPYSRGPRGHYKAKRMRMEYKGVAK